MAGSLDWRPLGAALEQALHGALGAALSSLAATRPSATHFSVVDLQSADEQTFMRALRLGIGRGQERFMPGLSKAICLMRLFGRGSICAVFDDPYVVALLAVRSSDVVIDVTALAVDENYQNEHIGSTIVSAAADVLSTDGRPLTAMVVRGNYRSLGAFLRAGFEAQTTDDSASSVWHLRWTGAEWPPPRSVAAPHRCVDVTTPALCLYPNLRAELCIRLPHIDVRVHTEPPLDSRHEQVLLIGTLGDCGDYMDNNYMCFEQITHDMQRLNDEIERLQRLRAWSHVCANADDLCQLYSADAALV